MRRKAIAILLLLFQALFLNVVVPGHTRGMITMEGKKTVRGLADLDGGMMHSCCAVKSGRGDQPTSQDRADCAICNLAVRLTTPPPIDLHLQPLALLERVRPSPAPVAASTRIISLYWGRAPPISHAT